MILFRLGSLLSLLIVGLGLVQWFKPVVRAGELFVGHDFILYFVRLYIGASHFWRNGLEVPHFTPYLSGGIPFFADPQSVYYSFPQLLSFWIDPLKAIQITYFVFYVLGYLGFLVLLRRSFSFSREASHLGALLFILNGFIFNHLYVGHLTHHAYLLFPWLFYFALEKRLGLFRQAAGMSLLLLYTLYSGGAHVLVVFATSLVIAFPFLFFHWKNSGELNKFFRLILFSLAIFLGGASGKLLAVSRFQSSFHFYPIQEVPSAMASFVWNYFWAMPSQVPPTMLFKNSFFEFGVWEYSALLSKICLPGILFFLWKNKKTQAFPWVLALSLLGLAIASGSEINSSLPFFKHYHNPVKILAAFIPIIIAMTAWSLNFYFQGPHKKSSNRVFLSLLLLVTLEGLYYLPTCAKSPDSVLTPYRPEAFAHIKNQGGLPPVRGISGEMSGDLPFLFMGITSIRTYEPLFGYYFEKVRSQLRPGPVTQAENGFFNLNHPGCFLYPQLNQCQPWDRIRLEDQKNFELFSEGRSVPTWVASWQVYHLKLNLFVIGLTILGLLGQGIAAKIVVDKKNSREKEKYSNQNIDGVTE